VVICLECVETVCPECDTRIHNKGMRIHHHRVPFYPNLFEDKCNPKFRISYFSRQCYRNNFSNRRDFNEEVRKYTYEKLLESTRKGVPMLLLEDLMEYLLTRFDATRDDILASLERELSGGLMFHQTIRTFGDYEPLKYFSLCLNSVSLESIVWIIKSIRNDRMQPNETLIHSRFKECFAIKVSMKEWKSFIDSLLTDPEMLKKLNRFKEIFGEINIKKMEDGSSLFLIKGVEWAYEDLQDVDEFGENYKLFINFIENFFIEREPNQGTKSNESLDPLKAKQLKKWLSSVENSHIKTSSTTSESNFKKIMEKDSIVKAIPGGKYGCALMLKNCGPDKLKLTSIGKISAFIKHALNKQVIIHHKTLIIKNEQKINENTSRKDVVIFEIQQNIINLLKESMEDGVTLAQLPLLLMKKYGKFYDFQEIGFPKLKNFLTTMEDYVELERSHNNHIKVRLKKKKSPLLRKEPFYNESCSQVASPKPNSPPRKDSTFSDNNLSHNNFPQNKGFKAKGSSTLKGNRFDQKCKEINIYSGRQGADHKKSVSDLSDYFTNISNIIISTLNVNNFGIEIRKLEEELSRILKTPFDPKIFSASDFKEFLLNNFDEFVNVEVRKTIKSGRNNIPNHGGIQYMVFPKTYKSLNPPPRMPVLPTKFDTHRLFESVYDKETVTDNISEISQNNLNVAQITQDSFSDNSFTKLHPIYPSSHENGKLIQKQKKDEDFKLYNGFEFAVVSPIYSHSNTVLNNDENEDEEIEENEMNFDNKSLQFVNFLVDEKDD
jgi:hypothetical protein